MNLVPLGNIAKIDRTVATNGECSQLPYVGLEHIEKDTGHFVTGFECKPDRVVAAKFKFTPNHILYGKLRPYLNKVAKPTFFGVCSTEILPILPKEDRLDGTYLWAMLLSPEFVDWSSSSVSGANLPRLDPKLLANYKIPLPPLAEQRRIAATLAKADRLRRLRRYALELSAGYLQAVFVEMFGDPLRNPNGWDVETVGSQINRIDSGWSPVCEESRTTSDEWAVLRLSSVTTGMYVPIENKKLPADLAPRPELEVKKGDVLITRKNTVDLVAACALVHDTPPRLMLPDTIFRFSFKESSDVVGAYLWGVLNEQDFRKKVQSLATGTAGSMPNISKEKFSDLLIPLPPLQLQQQFAEIVYKFERLRVQQEEAARQAEHLFQTLLQRAFRGELSAEQCNAETQRDRDAAQRKGTEIDSLQGVPMQERLALE